VDYTEKRLATKIRKLFRYIRIYGLSRSLVKVRGQRHMKKNFNRYPPLGVSRKDKYVAIIGCGNHAYSNTAYFIDKNVGKVIGATLDLDLNKAASLAQSYGAPIFTKDVNDIVGDVNICLVYIISNHSSHTEYAIDVLKSGKDVFIEKPVSVNKSQLKKLMRATRASNSKVYGGYNRPFTYAIREISKYVTEASITLQCFVMGHKLPSDHWYRDKSEGSRVVGNLGHWIDLSMHLMMARSNIPESFEVSLMSANKSHPDDDFTVSIKSNLDDLIILTLSTRCDPFEGVMESIHFQNESIVAKIDDFRELILWEGEKKIIKRFSPKDAGHKGSVLQPFVKDARNWEEVEYSTFLMLEVEDMLKNKHYNREINISSAIQELVG